VTYATLEDMVLATAESVRPPERLTVSQAAAKYRMLYNEGSYVGPWLNEKTPYLVEPMDVLTSQDHTGMIFAGPARTGKSDMFFNWLTYAVECDPADMMVVHMTQATARDWSQSDLNKAFFAKGDRNRPTNIGQRLIPGRQNDNVHDKRFVSGMRLLVKWPTITELSGKTIPRLWVMDYDRMTQDVDKEGNPYDLAKKRATTFKSYGMTVAESSPGFKVTDPKWTCPADAPHMAPPTEGILALYNRGDRRRWYWRCPQCHEAFEPDFSLLSYPNSSDPMEAAEQVVMVCPHDGFPMDPSFKKELNTAGRWLKEGQIWLPNGSFAGKARRSDIASFWMKGPAAAFQDWSSLVLNKLRAEEEFKLTGSENALKVTYNTDQGLPYTPRGSISDRLPEDLKARAREWGGTKDAPEVPDGVRFIVATIDVQNRAFVVQMHGIGIGLETSVIDSFKIEHALRINNQGDREFVDPAKYPEDWDVLIDEVLLRSYPLNDRSGRRMSVKTTACDSGGREGVTTNAYAFVRRLRQHPDGLHRRFHLVKGVGQPTAPRVRLEYPDSGRKDRHAGARGDIPVLMMNANLLKDQVSNMLGRADDEGPAIRTPDWMPDWFYTQVTAEVRNAKGQWDNPRRRRNEAWDLLYYAMGICAHLGVEQAMFWQRPPRWAGEWGTNDLVSSSNVNTMVGDQPRVGYSLSELGSSLA
jgi:phage terminase large subunit GpA-like protein